MSNCCAVCLSWDYSGGGSVRERRFELLRDMWSLTIGGCGGAVWSIVQHEPHEPSFTRRVSSSYTLVRPSPPPAVVQSPPLAMSRLRKSKSFLVPLALTATAAIAGLGLYLLLGSSSTQNPDPVERDRIPEVGEEEFERPQQLRPRSTPTGSAKKKIAVAVREDALGLLWNLPTSLNLATTDIFILVYSQQSAGNPEKVYKLVKDKFPKNYPREYVIPHTTEAALLPLLRHLAPEAVYMDESLVGEGGASVAGLLEGNWVGAVIVVSGGDPGKGKGAVDGWQQNVQKFGRRCTIVAKSGIQRDWMGRVG